MTHRSKVVDTQLAWGDFLREAITEHGDDAIEILSTHYERFDAYKKKALRRRFSAYFEMIAEVTRELRDAEHACVGAELLSRGHSDADEAVVKVCLALVRTRQALRRLDAEAEATFGLDHPEPEDPFSLLAYVEELQKKLEKHERMGPMSLRPFAQELAVPIRELSDALERDVIPDLAQWRARIEAQRSFERVLSSVASSLSAEFALAGMSELAEALRPNNRRLRGLEQPVFIG